MRDNPGANNQNADLPANARMPVDLEPLIPSQIMPAGQDQEQLAVVTFLARYSNKQTRRNYSMDLRQYMAFCRECVRRRKREAYRRDNPEDKSQASRTHCPRGHELAGDNLYRHRDGRRECKDCRRRANRESARRRYHEKKAEAAA